MKLEIIFEDKDLLIINKQTGLVVNRAASLDELTVQDLITTYLKISGLGIGDRAGIVHRLDRETSGLLIVAKTQKAFINLQTQFKERKIFKKYIALVHGKLHDENGTIDSDIIRIGKSGKFAIAKSRQTGKNALLEYQVIKKYKFNEIDLIEKFENLEFNKIRKNYLLKNAKYYSLVSIFPKTGRTHQIRVQFKSLSNPLVSDLIYTPGKLLNFDLTWCNRLFLHAFEIKFNHPSTDKIINFTCKLPKDLKNALLSLTFEA